MKTDFPCPCCKNEDWCIVSEYVYEKTPNESFEIDDSNSRASRLKMRKQVLFDIWFPGQQNITLTSKYCKACGFMCYSPRPSNADLMAKYQFLSTKMSIGALTVNTPHALSMDGKRESFMKEVIEKYRKGGSKKILDVGGGDGRLLRPFLKDGYNCYLVDFNEEPYPGIERIGATLKDVPAGHVFDVLICSHVLEHVSEPGEFLQHLRSVLSENGVLYIEVPLEIWHGIPISKDPVTHVNFFTVKSLKNALILNGLKPIAIESKIATYDGKYKRVAWAVASSIETGTSQRKFNGKNTQKLIRPGLLSKINRKVENLWLDKILNSSHSK